MREISGSLKADYEIFTGKASPQIVVILKN